MRVLIQDRTGKRARTKIKRMAEAALRGLGFKDCELSVLLVDDDGIRVLNRDFRHKDRPTDVLSFPLNDPFMLGDVVISMERAEAQAGEFGVPLDEELGRLLVHGILHLMGHDHVRGGAQARSMKENEAKVMGILREKGLC